MKLSEFAKDELKRWDCHQLDSAVVESVMELIEVFERQNHSGFCRHATVDLFFRLAHFEHLTELTNDPEEWVYHKYDETFQSRRNPAAFSTDLKSYTLANHPNEEYPLAQHVPVSTTHG